MNASPAPNAVVTGANSGIGKEIARGLAEHGFRVLMVCRNQERATAAMQDIRQDQPDAQLELVLADLSSQREVRRAAAEVAERAPRLQVLVNNAGGYMHKRRQTEDGLETMFAVNHLACFLLTRLLLDTLRAAAPARVVTVSSAGHIAGRLAFDDLQCERRFKAMGQYCNTKLANILFTKELAAREREHGVAANCFHPGAVRTGFAQDDRGFFGALVRLGAPFLRSAKRGADTGVYLATAPDVSEVTGEYFADRRIKKPSRDARDPALAHRLWEVSEALCGLHP